MKVQNSGKYTCIARNGARNLTSDTVIEEEKMIELLVRCKLSDAQTLPYFFTQNQGGFCISSIFWLS